jgi:hypothetical protein
MLWIRHLEEIDIRKTDLAKSWYIEIPQDEKDFIIYSYMRRRRWEVLMYTIVSIN